MNSKNQRKSGAILSYVSIFVNTVIQLFYTPLITKMLGQSEYGLYSLANSTIGYLSVLDLGFGNAIIVFTAKYRAQNDKESEQKLHGMFKVVFFIIGCIAMLIGAVLYFNVNAMFGKTMTPVELKKIKIIMLMLIFNLGMTFTFSIYSSIICAYEKFAFLKLMTIASAILKPLVIIPLLFIGIKSVEMALVITVVNVSVLLSYYFFCKKNLGIDIKFRGFDGALFKVILGYSIWIFLTIIVDTLNWNIDQFILGAVSGTVAVSIYSMASQINTMFRHLSTAISGVALPKMAKMVAKNASSEQLTDEFIKISRVQAYIIYLMTTGILLFGKQFIYLWIGKEYNDSYYCLLWLAVPLSFVLIQNSGVSIRQALNRHQFATIVNVVVAFINFVCSIFLAKRFGPVGSAIGTGIGTIVSVIIIDIYYHKVLKINMVKFWKNILCLISKYIIPFAVFYFIVKRISISGYPGLIVYVVVYTAVFAAVSYFFNMNDYEKGLITSFVNKIKRKS